MSYAEVKKNIWRNSVSNYMRTVVMMTAGVISFRLLYQGLPLEQFGFWVLLWSVFGYGILLDFGFGFASQKRVAELSVTKDWEALSRVISTIFFFYLGMAVLIVSGVILGADTMLHAFDVSEHNMPEFRKVMILFFVGIAVAFPMGIFPEVLRGQQRIQLLNNLASTAGLLRIGLLWAAFHYHWSFMAIMAISLFLSIAPDMIAGCLALKNMPGVRISPRLFSWDLISGTMRFSLFAYINTATAVILSKTDQLVLGTVLGVAAVAMYQAGNKVAEVFSQFTRQIQDTLSPAAAYLNASGNHEALRDLMQQSLRWCVILSTPLYLLCAFYLTELLQLLTGDTVIPRETWLVGQVLLVWFYANILTHSVSRRIYMMIGHERKLMWLGLAEAAANLIISVGLVLIFRNVICVAIGSLIPTLYFGWVHLWPWMAREGGLTSWQLIRKTALSVWLAVLPLVALLTVISYVPALKFSKIWITLPVHGMLAGILSMVLIWRFALTQNEKASVASKVPFLKRRLTPVRSMPMDNLTASDSATAQHSV